MRELLQQAEQAYRGRDFAAVARIFGMAGRDTALRPAQVMMFAHALTETGAPARAEALMQGLMRRTGQAAAPLLLAAQAAAAQRAYGRALSCAAAAEHLAPAVSAAPEMVFQMLVRLGAAADAMAALQRAAARQAPMAYATVNDLCALAGLSGQPEAIPKLLQGLPPPDVPAGPTHLFVAMPKSGGATIGASIAARLGASFAGIGADLPGWAGMPAPWLPPPLLDYLAGRRSVLLSHAAALAENDAAFGRFGRPLLVHLRDPRDALVSLFEMAEELGGLQLLRFLRLHPGYALLDRNGRLAVLRERVYPLYLRWIEAWLRRAEARPGSVQFSTFEGFLRDPAGLVADLAQRYGGTSAATAPLSNMHFRRGKSGSHRDYFDAPTSRRMYEDIPAAARDRFGWQT